MTQTTRKGASRLTPLYYVCECGKAHPRGIASDYEIECECEAVLIIPMAEVGERKAKGARQ